MVFWLHTSQTSLGFRDQLYGLCRVLEEKSIVVLYTFSQLKDLIPYLVEMSNTHIRSSCWPPLSWGYQLMGTAFEHSYGRPEEFKVMGVSL